MIDTDPRAFILFAAVPALYFAALAVLSWRDRRRLLSAGAATAAIAAIAAIAATAAVARAIV